MKPVILIMAPVATVSGYGARSRDIAYALIKSGKYEVKIWNTRWGATPMNALNPNNEKHKAILDCLMQEPRMNSQPDIFIQVTVPNEFQRLGKYNIGVTAGIETTIAAAGWIEGCNRMDLVLTSSNHSKKVFEESVWMKHNEQTKQPEGEVRLTTPIDVLFEGVDLETYFQTRDIHKSVDDELKQIPEDFAFLFVGHWLQGDFGQDRKDVAAMIRTFLEAFKNKQKKPALILKTSAADFSVLDRDDIINRINQVIQSTRSTNLPNVYLLHGDFTDDEMNSLYNHPKVKAHVSLTKGEGYGRPLAEASVSQKPLIVSNWSGHLDFIKEDGAILLPGTLTNVHPSAAWKDVLLEESQWFTADYGYAASAMRSIYDKPKDYVAMAKKQAYNVRTNFSLDKMEEALINVIDSKLETIPQQNTLKLPQLKKVELPKLKKIEQ